MRTKVNVLTREQTIVEPLLSRPLLFVPKSNHLDALVSHPSPGSLLQIQLLFYFNKKKIRAKCVSNVCEKAELTIIIHNAFEQI
jgi:hypothetical protein